MAPPVFVISGPPASGKSTLCAALLARFERGFHLPVDEVRGWVVMGMADSVPWTDETERQFRIAEAAACDMAGHYHAAGFAVAIDHCRNPKRLDEVVASSGIPAIKILLLPDLATNLERSHSRTTKSFDPHLLDGTIESTNARYRLDAGADWAVVDNSRLGVAATVELVLGRLSGPA